MYSARRVNLLLPVAVIAALVLTGCMSNASAGGGASTADAPQSAAASAPNTSAPSASATSAAGSPSAAAPAASSQPPAPAGTPPSSTPAPAAAQPVTFTFGDGRLSMVQPVGWRVDRTGRLESPYFVENATVYDAAGNEQIRIFYSDVGGANMGPLTRTVLHSEPVPGLQGHSAPAAHASFFVDNIYGELHYRMAITAGPAVSPDGKPAADATIVGGNRILAATVILTGPPFANDEAAKAWLAGGEGQALKSLLMSFTYR